jgi:hypothetical protein
MNRATHTSPNTKLVVMTVANAPISLKARWRSHVPNYPFVSFPQPESAAARRLALGGYSAFLAHPKQILGYHQVDSTSATRRPAVPCLRYGNFGMQRLIFSAKYHATGCCMPGMAAPCAPLLATCHTPHFQLTHHDPRPLLAAVRSLRLY